MQELETNSSAQMNERTSRQSHSSRVAVEARGGMECKGSREACLVVKGEVLNIAADGLPGPGSHTHHLQPRQVQLLCQMVNSNIGGCCHQHLHKAHMFA